MERKELIKELIDQSSELSLEELSYAKIESLDQVLIVDDEEFSSEALIGKSALIVKSDAEFSHLLAFSRSLRIPSMYATDISKLPESFIINVSNYQNKAVIEEIVN